MRLVQFVVHSKCRKSVARCSLKLFPFGHISREQHEPTVHYNFTVQPKPENQLSIGYTFVCVCTWSVWWCCPEQQIAADCRSVCWRTDLGSVYCGWERTDSPSCWRRSPSSPHNLKEETERWPVRVHHKYTVTMNVCLKNHTMICVIHVSLHRVFHRVWGKLLWWHYSKGRVSLTSTGHPLRVRCSVCNQIVIFKPTVTQKLNRETLSNMMCFYSIWGTRRRLSW